jgi:hypothetical protein
VNSFVSTAKIVSLVDLVVAHWHLIKVSDGRRMKRLILHDPAFSPWCRNAVASICGFNNTDCPELQPGGSCFDPQANQTSSRAHASFAMNQEYQLSKQVIKALGRFGLIQGLLGFQLAGTMVAVILRASVRLLSSSVETCHQMVQASSRKSDLKKE